jgi:hypothetical protein
MQARRRAAHTAHLAGATAAAKPEPWTAAAARRASPPVHTPTATNHGDRAHFSRPAPLRATRRTAQLTNSPRAHPTTTAPPPAGGGRRRKRTPGRRSPFFHVVAYTRGRAVGPPPGRGGAAPPRSSAHPGRALLSSPTGVSSPGGVPPPPPLRKGRPLQQRHLFGNLRLRRGGPLPPGAFASRSPLCLGSPPPARPPPNQSVGRKRPTASAGLPGCARTGRQPAPSRGGLQRAKPPATMPQDRKQHPPPGPAHPRPPRRHPATTPA